MNQMKVTRELLVKLKACQQGLDLLDKYPEGASLIELAQDPDTTLEDFFFARHYFHFTEEELELYNKKCNIINCNGHILQSYDVINSNWVYKSNNIIDSNYISNSEDVKKSNEIKSSITVNSSENIINSKNISYSQNIADSNNILTSNNIINSSNIKWSQIINSSHDLEECNFCYKSDNLNECSFCGFVTNSKHCLFCNNISDTDYQIFNKTVTWQEFERVKKELEIKLESETVDLLNIKEDKHLDNRFSYDLRFDRMFEKLSEDFYGWVSSLPYYDEQIFLLLFFTTLK